MADIAQQVDHILHILLLGTMEHQCCQRDVAAYGDAVPVSDFLRLDDVHVLVDRHAVRFRLAHDLHLSCGIPANEERGQGAFLPHVFKDRLKRLVAHSLEVVRRYLGHQRINDGDDIHARFNVIVRHLKSHFRREVHQLFYIVLVQDHVHEDLVASQVGGQCERSADQAVQRRVGPYRSFIRDIASSTIGILPLSFSGSSHLQGISRFSCSG